MARKKKLPVIAIVGRPNVGKSSLFNRLRGHRHSIVGEVSGMTRDRVIGHIYQYDKPFTLIDTGGVTFDKQDNFAPLIEMQVKLAIEEADAVIFVLDGKEGLLPLDKQIAEMLRDCNVPIYCVVNKVDTDFQEKDLPDFYNLGFDNVWGISATHGRNVSDLINDVLEKIPGASQIQDENTAISLAIVGRPNVGKSSLVNLMLNEERMIVSDVAGTTRDAVDISIKRQGQEYVLIDTAGLRYRRKVKENVEFYSVQRTLQSIDRCDVAILVISAEDGLTTLDLKVLEEVKQRGTPCILLVNKWDLKPGEHQKEYLLQHMHRIDAYSYVPYLFVSAKTGKNVPKLLDMVEHVYHEQDNRITTGVLNRFLERVVKQSPPPIRRGKRPKLYYISQVDKTPPTFLISVNDGRLIDTSYKRYLENRIREEYGFVGLPIRIRCEGREDSAKTSRK